MTEPEDTGPPTTPSLRGPAIVEQAPSVGVTEAPVSNPSATSRHAAVRVDRRLRKTKAHMMPKNERLVLRTLAGHADMEDKCHPSVPTLADECGMSEATARACVRSLIAKHWLFVSDNNRIDADGKQTSNEYTLTPEQGEWWPVEERHRLARPTPRERRERSEEPVSRGDTPPVSPPVPVSPHDTVPVSNGDTIPPQTVTPSRYQAVIPSRSHGVTHEEPNEAPSEEATEEPKMRADADARVCETTSKTMSLFGEPDPDPEPPAKRTRAKAHKDHKPEKPKSGELYSAAYAAGQIDAEPRCGFRPLGEADCRLLGATAAAHAKDPRTGEPITGEPLLVWIRETSTAFRRAVEPAYSKGYAVHVFATWLDSGRPKTRKVPLPKPPEPPKPKREIPPPNPIPEMFYRMGEAHAAAGGSSLPPFLMKMRPKDLP